MIVTVGSYRPRRVPVLDAEFPQDIAEPVPFPYLGISITFQVKFLRGNPNRYTYRWYVNGAEIEKTNSPTFIYILKSNGVSKVYCEVDNGYGNIVRSRTATVTGAAAKQYLYSRGNQYTEETGGWIAINSGIPSYESYFGSAELMDGKMYMSAKQDQSYGGRCATVKRIDVTNYKSISFDCYAYGKVAVAIGSDQTPDGIIVEKRSTWTHSGWSGILTIDVSDKTEEVYILCLAGPSQNTADYAEVYEVWME